MIHSATRTGPVDLLDPAPETITLEAMAHGLGQLNRWTGCLEVPFAVAQHSVLVYDLFISIAPQLRPWALWALKHDGHEYLIGDITTPTVELLCAYDAGFARRVDSIKYRLDRLIERRFGLPDAPREVHDAVTEADQLAAAVEWRTFMPAANGRFPRPLSRPLPRIRPRPLTWAAAADLFRQTFERELATKAWEGAANA
jgi:hypothetical protein